MSTHFLKETKKVLLIDEYLSEEKLSNLIQAADVAVFPFQRVTTSSSVFHTFSAQKAVIAPKIGFICDFPKDTGIYYSPNTQGNLSQSMMFAFTHKEKLKVMANSGYRYAAKFTWKEAAKKTRKMYQNLLHS